MTNPIVVGASENHFVPVLVVNNKAGGKDAKTLSKFNEPSWNYQVMRFINKDEKDIIPRKDQVWTTLPYLTRMQEALEKQEKEAPRYLKLAISEQETSKHKTIAISQYCYWTGEAKLGRIHGVVNTEAGYFDGREVTKITYHTGKIQIKDLLTEARKLKCADGAYITDKTDLATAQKAGIIPAKAFGSGYRKAGSSDQKKQIESLSLPKNLTQAQLTKFNSFIHVDQKKALSFLTENQRALVKVK